MTKYLYLHLVAGFQGKEVGIGKDFQLQVKRDIALVNKASDALDSMRRYIPECWFQLQNKGLVMNETFECTYFEAKI